MKLSILGASATLALVIALPALAQPAGFARLDRDGDGLVSAVEFAEREPQRGPRILAQADADGDGAVTRGEVQAAIEEEAAQRKARMEAHLLAAFEAMDTNEDGYVTPEEAEAHVFARADADGDGFLSKEEARAMRERHQDRTGRRPGPPRAPGEA